MLRLPDDMRDKLKAVAKANNRTMNAEIVSRLEVSLATPSQPGIPPAMLAELERLLDEKLGGIKAVIDTKNGLQEATIVRKKTFN